MVESNFEQIAKKAKISSKKLITISPTIKNEAILAIASAIEANKDLIFSANKRDLEAAKDSVPNSICQ